jgi:hypothetical protein|nr:MAG TPA: hypothetical protein [Bacteriophage sp.]
MADIKNFCPKKYWRIYTPFIRNITYICHITLKLK